MPFSFKIQFDTGNLQDVKADADRVQAQVSSTRGTVDQTVNIVEVTLQTKLEKLKSDKLVLDQAIETYADEIAKEKIAVQGTLDLWGEKIREMERTFEALDAEREKVWKDIDLTKAEIKSAGDRVAEIKAEAKKAEWSAGQVMTFITSLIRLTTRFDRSQDRVFDQWASYIASMAAHTASLAWAAASLSTSQGNPFLASVQATLAVTAMAQATQTLVDRAGLQAQRSYEDEFYSGDRPF